MERKLVLTLAALAARWGLCGVLGSVLVCVEADAQTISPDARRHFTLARQAQDAGALDVAAREYAATVRLAPRLAGAWANLGLVRYVQGEYKGSVVALEQALALDPSPVGPNLYLGIDLLKLNQSSKALPYLQRAALKEPGNRDAQSWLGTGYWETGATYTALEQLRKTEATFPHDPDLMFVLGEAYRKSADGEMEALLHEAGGTAFAHQVYGDIYLDQHAFAKAAGHLRTALEQDPAAPAIHDQLGDVELLQGHLAEAAEQFREQLRRTPADARAKARLGEDLLLQGQVAAALDLLQEAIALSPLDTVYALRMPPSFATGAETFDESTLARFRAALPVLEQTPASPAHHLALAVVAARLGQTDHLEAEWTAFSASVAQQPAAPELSARAQGDFERGNFEQCEAEILAYLRTHPHDLKAQLLLARTHRLLSLGVLDRLITEFPESFRSHQLLAQTYAQREDDMHAILEYKKVEELAPTLPGVHYALGHLLANDGRPEEAIAQLKEELRLNPDHPEANAEMGTLLLTADETQAAIPFLSRAIALQPDLWVAHRQLGKAYSLEKNYTGAREELTLALADDPEGMAHYQLGLVYKALGQPEAASREFASSRQIKSDRLAQIKVTTPQGPPHE